MHRGFLACLHSFITLAAATVRHQTLRVSLFCLIYLFKLGK